MKKTLYCVAVIALTACNKKEFLSEKPNQSHVVPTTLKELRAVLDSDDDMNGMGEGGRGPVPNLGEIGSDTYFVPNNEFNNTLREEYRNCYIWSKGPYVETELFSWKWPYRSVFLSNIVLDELSKIDRLEGGAEYDLILGDALFYRAHTFYQLAQVFAPHYRRETAKLDKGIPLRLSADVGEELFETTVEETYDRIIQDLNEAIELLSESVPVKTRPTKQAAYALLARVYLNKRDYGLALSYADSCLRIQSNLLDYNLLEVESNYPFLGLDQSNPEIIFSCNMTGMDYLNYPIRPRIGRVDSSLYEQYNEFDLRKRVFFRNEENGESFKGSYNGSNEFFAGIATDEVYLIRAECNSRLGRLDKAIDDLNLLRASRWDVNIVYTPLVISNQEDMQNAIILERRKELLFRGLRWVDLRRLNQEGKNIILKRTVNGEIYTLFPDDPRYTWPFPDDVLAFKK